MAWLSEAKCIELFGAERAKRFLQRFGGSRLHVPVRPKKNHVIAKEFGLVTLAALCREYSGQHMNIANACRNGTKKLRIMDMLEKGVAVLEIALSLGVSSRYVYQIKKECGLSARPASCLEE